MLQSTGSTSPAIQKSITGTESFAARLLRSERWRIGLMAAALGVTLVGVMVRRALGGAVMSVNATFYGTLAVLLAGLAYQLLAAWVVRRRARLGGGIPTWQRCISVAADLAVPGAVLLILQLHSTRGAYAALSGPSLLLMPLVIFLSVLRLRPWFSLGTGMGAALIHFALVIHATRIADIEPDHFPVLFSYGVLLLVSGAAAAAISWLTRRYVIEAVEEAGQAERAQRAVALIEQDLRVAHDIQMGLLPTDRPAIPGYEVAGMARPAAQAGGDYYDWQPLPDGRLVVAIADVTGHGIGPALVMAVCRAYARASAPLSAGPDALLERLNDLIFEDVKGARFITMVVAVVSADGNAELVSAGHGPTLLYRAAAKEVEWFGGDGLPLGVVSKENYGPRRQFYMDSGDVLVMLTDGFFEHARSGDGQQFGIKRLTEALRENATAPPPQIIAAIDRAVTDFANGARQEDDMTAVVIKRV
jgi:serine phosphatase RsbU (regulator of sigma subunit)